MLSVIRECIKYFRETTATIAVAFAVMVPVIVGASGFALDFAHAYLVQQRLAQALDAAALAAAASATEEDDIKQRVKDFFEANYPPEKLGITFEPEVIVSDKTVTVTGHAQYLTFFLNVIGIEQIDVSAKTIVQRRIQGLEVVLVLDNTGSMASYNNIEALKDASEAFINILFDNTSNPNYIKIGMVPYSNSVRIGKYGLGQNPDGTQYADGDVFVHLPGDVSYTTDHTSANWYGCVVEHKHSNYSATATHVSGSKGQLWKNGSNWNGHGWNPGSTTNDPYNYDVLDNYEGYWDIYSFGRLINQNDKCSNYSGYSNSRCSSCNGTDSKCSTSYCFCWQSDSNHGTNQGCPYAYIMPLTSDRDALIDRLDDMIPDGNTLGNIGMAWGYRVLSPEPPFEEATDWENVHWQKAIVMMTDGDNTENGTYSSYWFTPKNNMSVTKFNQRFEETCNALKQKDVLIYTVTFTSGINDTTKGYYRRCATSEDQYFDAPTQSELIEVFKQISRELSSLHITY